MVKAGRKLAQSGIRNVRLALLDGKFGLRELFQDGSVAQVYVNFPCPWPKSRHAQRRLVDEGFAQTLAAVLAQKGEFHLVTDALWYAQEAGRKTFRSRALRSGGLFPFPKGGRGRATSGNGVLAGFPFGAWSPPHKTRVKLSASPRELCRTPKVPVKFLPREDPRPFRTQGDLARGRIRGEGNLSFAGWKHRAPSHVFLRSRFFPALLHRRFPNTTRAFWFSSIAQLSPSGRPR